MFLCAVVLAAGSLTACARQDTGEPLDDERSDDPLCELLSVPISSLASAGRSFADVVRPTEPKGVGIGAMLLFATGREVPEAGEFEPALTYLGERAWVELEREEGRLLEEPELTDEIVENARALDEELATGRCET